MADEGAERNLAPSAKKLDKAASDGDVLRSRDLATAAAMLVGACWLKFAGPWVFSTLFTGLAGGLSFTRDAIEDFTPGVLLLRLVLATLPPILLLGAGIAAAVMIVQIGPGNGRWVMENLALKPGRLNPLSGIKRVFGVNGLIELGKSTLKALLLGAIAFAWARGHAPALHGLTSARLSGQLLAGWDAITSLLFALTFGLVVVALIDFPIQWLRRWQRLKMSHQERKDEAKEADGSPENKQAVRRRQAQLARGNLGRMLQKAQFVITNPSHFAVAMCYDPAVAAAPFVLAKGRDERALVMKELAREMGVPVLEYPALARSVYFTTRENQVIREELYVAVAGIVAFVLALKRGEQSDLPAIEVPVEMLFDANGRLEIQ